MKPLFYILRKSLKNILKETTKKPLVLILYILLAASFLGMLVISFAMPSNLVRKGSIETYGAIVGGVLLVMTYFSIKQGIDKGSSFFRLADANFVFTAPISPKKVLLYGFIKQLFTTLFTILFISFQIPNLKNNFAIDGIGVLIIYLGIALFVFTMPLIGMLIYSATSKSARIRKNFETGFHVVLFLVGGGFLYYLIQTKDVMKAAAGFLNSGFFASIPFLGWIRGILMTAMKGIGPDFYVNVALVLASLVLMGILLYRVKTDYYEDVLAETERREELYRMKREGKANMSLYQSKVKKVRYQYKGSGVSAIFHRQMMEYKKTGFFFINRSSIAIVAAGVASRYFFPGADIKTVLFFTIYMLFFFSMRGKWVQELEKPYIYLIPASSFQKVIYSTLPETLKNGVDGLLLFITAGLLLKADPVVILLSAAAYMTYGMFYTYEDILSRRLFGSLHAKALEVFLRIFLLLVLIVPGIVIFIIFGAFTKGMLFGEYYAYLFLIAYNLIICGLMLFLSKGVFEELEMK